MIAGILKKQFYGKSFHSIQNLSNTFNLLNSNKLSNSILQKYNFSTLLEPTVRHKKESQISSSKMTDKERKELKRQKRREKMMNMVDPELTTEQGIPSWTEKKGKVLYKFLNEYININRLVRKPIPEQDKNEYIKRSKEMNLYYLDKFRKRKAFEKHFEGDRERLNKIMHTIPENLQLEILDGRATYEFNHPYYNEETEDIIYQKFHPDFLYFHQIQRLLPDECRCFERATRFGFVRGESIDFEDYRTDIFLFEEDEDTMNAKETDFDKSFRRKNVFNMEKRYNLDTTYLTGNNEQEEESDGDCDIMDDN